MAHNTSMILFLCYALLLLTTTSNFTPITSYFLNCGTTTTTILNTEANATSTTRVFTTDSEYLNASYNTTQISVIAVSGVQYSYDINSLYTTARIFNGVTTYRFTTKSSGTYVLRLHFFPFVVDDYDLSSAKFDVIALGRFVLINEFSVSSVSSPVIKEYLLWVDDGKELTVTFTPNTNFGFVNAIEMFTAPTNILKSENEEGIAIDRLNRQALETVYRLNVGGLLVKPETDTLWRTWSPDDNYVVLKDASNTTDVAGSEVKYRNYGEEIAPRSVYDSARIINDAVYIADDNVNLNITWSFGVNAGYKYLIRLHFCDFKSAAYDSMNYFDIYVGNETVLNKRSKDFTQNFTEAFYMDFLVIAPKTNRLYVSIAPIVEKNDLIFIDNIYLNGLEMFKLNNSFGSMDRDLFHYPAVSQKKNLKVITIAVLTGILLLIGLIVVCLVMKRKLHLKARNVNSFSFFKYLEGSAPNKIPWFIIKAATRDFDDKLVLGRGGFGKVYKGVLTDGTIVAVKRRLIGSRQGCSEFDAEINILTKIRHQHLVSLIGYCDEKDERVLIYEYMMNGTLRDCLYGSPDKPCLSWKQRLEICIGAAKGFHYLHTGFSYAIIHRDVKSSNILLGENYLAKVSDFGLSKLGPPYGETHITTNIKGTFGYIDPRYFRTLKLTDKSDVYSFGVLLFEVLCARPVIQQGVTEEQLNLVEWALHWKRLEQLEKIIDARIAGTINENSLREFVEIAEKCLAEHVELRPNFGDVLWNLEHALQLQVCMDGNEFPSNMTNLVADQNAGTVIGHSISTMSSIFSELRNDEGR